MIPYRFNPLAISLKSEEPIYFTLKALTNNSSVELIQTGSVDISQLYYKTKNTDWTLYSYNNPITLNKNQYIQFYNHSNNLSTSNSNYVKFSLTGEIESLGNIQSLINFNENAPNYCFRRLFQNCSALVKAPKVLPAKNVGQYSYGAMFSKSGVANMPDIQATIINQHGCYYMFEECPIEYVPKLHVSTVNYIGFGCMFINCKSLKSFGEFFVSNFSGTTACQQMFQGCTNLINGPAILPVTIPQRYSYDKMFYNCSKLEKAPILPMTQLYTECYKEMFKGCSSLKEYQVAFTEWPTNNATLNWINGARNNSDVIFKCPAALDTTIKDNSHVLSDWTIINI